MNHRASSSLASFLLLSVVNACAAFATSPCDQWAGTKNLLYTGPWETDPQAAANDVGSWCAANLTTCISQACTPTMCQILSYTAVSNGGFPSYLVSIPYLSCDASGGNCFRQRVSDLAILVRTNPNGCSTYVAVPAPPAVQCRSGCVADPIDPASGETFLTDTDTPLRGDLSQFQRFYSSTAPGTGDMGPSWRHTYSRQISPKYASSQYRPYVPSQDVSSLYTDEAKACTSGFAEIQSRVSTWANATATYANNVCTLSIGTTAIGRLDILYQSPPTPDPSTQVIIGYDATRDDGQLVRFTVNGGSISAPPSIPLNLQQTAAGFQLSDERDNIELYDSNGRLQSITTRAGVVQTLSYDTSGRLSTVIDSFGHRLTLGYDSLSRISTVTRQ